MGSTDAARRAGTKQASVAEARGARALRRKDERVARTLIHPLRGGLSNAMQSSDLPKPQPTFTAVEDMTIRKTSADFGEGPLRMPIVRAGRNRADTTL